MKLDSAVKLVSRICMVAIIFALAFWVMLWIGHEKSVQCSIVSGSIKKTVTKEAGKPDNVCNTPHLVVQYIANNQPFTAPASDSPINTEGACLSTRDAQLFATNYPINSFQTCWYDPETPLNVHFQKTTYKPLANLCLKIAFFCFVILIVIKLARRRSNA